MRELKVVAGIDAIIAGMPRPQSRHRAICKESTGIRFSQHRCECKRRLSQSRFGSAKLAVSAYVSNADDFAARLEWLKKNAATNRAAGERNRHLAPEEVCPAICAWGPVLSKSNIMIQAAFRAELLVSTPMADEPETAIAHRTTCGWTADVGFLFFAHWSVSLTTHPLRGILFYQHLKQPAAPDAPYNTLINLIRYP
jgi:hypothetical protein